MNASKALVPVCVLVGLLADTAGAVNIETVPVGNPGNPGDTRYPDPYRGVSSFGSVAHAYNIGKYEVTAGQYTEFLNKVAGVDTYDLYYPLMWSSPYGCKIERYAGAGTITNPYRYRVAADWANRPVDFVTYWDACRFANWLHNGQPTGAQGANTTETGAYTLNGYNGYDGRTIPRNPDARWAIPTEDEWYKAAYHKNDGVTGDYWDYPTGTDNTPSNVLGNPTDAGNNATFYDMTSQTDTIGDPYWKTEVGAHENSPSPYGTFDQGGNVWEWNETIVYQGADHADRGMRGGAFGYLEYHLGASSSNQSYPTVEQVDRGFRVVQVPEPATLLLLALGGLAVMRRRLG